MTGVYSIMTEHKLREGSFEAFMSLLNDSLMKGDEVPESAFEDFKRWFASQGNPSVWPGKGESQHGGASSKEIQPALKLRTSEEKSRARKKVASNLAEQTATKKNQQRQK